MIYLFLLNSLFALSLFGVESSETSVSNRTEELSIATFAGGCFWSLQPAFDKIAGVESTKVGYVGGHKINPTYEDVSSGESGHYEAIQVFYDPKIVSYEKLLDVFWHNIDPSDASGQFCDKGSQYRSAIFYANDKELHEAENSKNQLLRSGRFIDVHTEVLPASKFYDAEDYHQSYYQKNPIRYRFYRYVCGREKRLNEVWGKDR